MASTLTVRLYEVIGISGWIAGLWWVRRQRNPVYAGAYLGASFLVFFDWIFNCNWFFRLVYDEKLVMLWRVEGVGQPLIMAFTYPLYVGVLAVALVQRRRRIDARFGRAGWAWIFLAGAVLQPIFDAPLVSWFHLYRYYQRPAYLVWGVPWSNAWLMGMLLVACYGAIRVVVATAWDRQAQAVLAGSPDHTLPPGAQTSAAAAFVMGAGAVWAAFFASMAMQTVWYLVAQPWTTAPRPF